MLDRAQVLRVHQVGTVFVFLDRHQLARAFAFFEQARCHRRMQISRRVLGRFMHPVIPAAGVGAAALIGFAPVEIAGKQAAARVGDAERAMHEDLQLDVRALLADFGDLVERQFARQDDAGNAELLPEAHRGVIHRVGLHRQMNRHRRPVVAHQRDEAGVRP